MNKKSEGNDMRGYLSSDIIALIEKHHGNIRRMALDKGTCRTTIKNYIEKWASTRQAYKDIVEGVLDDVEGNMFAKALEGDMGAMKFVLQCKGKDRGWGKQREEIEEELLGDMLTGRAILKATEPIKGEKKI